VSEKSSEFLFSLTAAIENSASTVPEIVTELESTQQSERKGRLIGLDQVASIERKKQEGCF